MKYFKFNILIAFLFIATIIKSQTVSLNGHITDKQGSNLFAVNVFLLKHSNVGTTTDLSGNFNLKIPNTSNIKGDYLVFSFIGYNQKKISLDSIDFSTPLNVALFENAQRINEVVVEGRKSISREFSIKELDKLKIYLSPLSSADPLKAIAMLPSSTNTNETANPELRGSDANRTKVFLNGVPITNPVRNSQLNGIGFFSLLNTELIKNEFVYPSNPPLIYGNTSAGMIDIETEDGLESNSYQLSMSLANTGVSLSQKVNSKNFLQLYGNKMFSDGYLKVNPSLNKQLKGFNSNDFGVNYHIDFSKNFSLNLYNYLVSETSNVLLNLFTWQDNAKAKTLRDFSILNLKYQKLKNSLSFNVGSNYQKSHFIFGNINSLGTQKQLYLSINLKHQFSENLNIQTGVSNDYSNFRFNDDIPVNYYAMSSASAFYHAVTALKKSIPEGYLYFRWKPIHKIIWGIGVRKNLVFADKNNPNYLSIQTNLRFNFRNNNSLLFSVGQYHNYSEPYYDQKEFRLLSSKHLSLEYIYEKKSTTINLATYYKHENGDLIGPKNIKGIEIYLEQNLLEYFKVSVSNTILNSEISLQDRSYNADNNVGYFLNATLSFFNPRFINISASWLNRPGKFYTPITSSTYDPAAKFYEPIYSDNVNSNRFDDYNTINVSISKVLAVQKSNIIVFVSIFNILNNRNQRGLNYNSDYSSSTFDYYQMRSIYFGCAISLK